MRLGYRYFQSKTSGDLILEINTVIIMCMSRLGIATGFLIKRLTSMQRLVDIDPPQPIEFFLSKICQRP